MKYLKGIAFGLFIFTQLLAGKDSSPVEQAFNAYQNDSPDAPKTNLDTKSAIANLMAKETPSIEETLAALASFRREPSKELLPQMKELWTKYHKSTFRSRDPENWTYIRSIDYNQKICDEIKSLIQSAGGDIDDIEPVEERATATLASIRSVLERFADASEGRALPHSELSPLVQRLSQVIKAANFGSANDDQKLQLIYLVDIVDALGNEKVWPSNQPDELSAPMIVLLEEMLTKVTGSIDNKWVQQPTGSNDPEPTFEQTVQWRKNSLEGYQQMNLRKLRDQILSKVAKLIKAHQTDESIKQDIINRFSKDVESQKLLHEKL